MKTGPYREPEKIKKKCESPLEKGCVRDATVKFREWHVCEKCYVELSNDAGMMG